MHPIIITTTDKMPFGDYQGRMMKDVPIEELRRLCTILHDGSINEYQRAVVQYVELTMPHLAEKIAMRHKVEYSFDFSYWTVD